MELCGANRSFVVVDHAIERSPLNHALIPSFRVPGVRYPPRDRSASHSTIRRWLVYVDGPAFSCMLAVSMVEGWEEAMGGFEELGLVADGLGNLALALERAI